MSMRSMQKFLCSNFQAWIVCHLISRYPRSGTRNLWSEKARLGNKTWVNVATTRWESMEILMPVHQPMRSMLHKNIASVTKVGTYMCQCIKFKSLKTEGKESQHIPNSVSCYSVLWITVLFITDADWFEHFPTIIFLNKYEKPVAVISTRNGYLLGKLSGHRGRHIGLLLGNRLVNRLGNKLGNGLVSKRFY